MLVPCCFFSILVYYLRYSNWPAWQIGEGARFVLICSLLLWDVS